MNKTSNPESNEIYSGLVWDDLRFPATTIRQGTSTKPDFDTTNLGLAFPQNDTDEIAYIIAQIPHQWKQQTELHPHIHFIQTDASTPIFKMDYRWYENGEDPSIAFTTVIADDFKFTYTSGKLLQIVDFPLIDGTGKDSVSSILDIKLYRDDNIITGDVIVKEFDIHYQIDSLGSRQEYIK